jgi:hypothetical protein
MDRIYTIIIIIIIYVFFNSLIMALHETETCSKQ